MKKTPKTISLQEFTKNFTAEQHQIVREELQYYELLTKFKKARQEKGFSQEALAEKAKINRTTLSQIESGSRNATVNTLLRISQALGMNLQLKLS